MTSNITVSPDTNDGIFSFHLVYVGDKVCNICFSNLDEARAFKVSLDNDNDNEILNKIINGCAESTLVPLNDKALYCTYVDGIDYPVVFINENEYYNYKNKNGNSRGNTP